MIHHGQMQGRVWREAAAPAPAVRCGACPLRGAELCRAIAEEGGPRTSPPPLRRYGRGRPILEKGAPLGLIGVIRRGYARRSEMRVNGKRVLFGLAVPGDIVGGLHHRQPGTQPGMTPRAHRKTGRTVRSSGRTTGFLSVKGHCGPIFRLKPTFSDCPAA